MCSIKIIGGHGRVALLIARELSKVTDKKIVSLVRSEDQFDEVRAAGADPQLFDVQNASVSDFASVFNGAEYVIWSAGAGGKGGPTRTYAIDRDAAIRSMQAAREVATVSRYVMVSYLGSPHAAELPTDHPLYHYGQAKHAADEYLVEKSGLNYTIVSPGHLSDVEPSGRVNVKVDPSGSVVGSNAAKREISRANVAKIIATLLTDKVSFEKTEGKDVPCLDGDTPIEEALRNL